MRTTRLKFAIAMAVMAVASVSAQATESEIYGGVGTTGVSIGYARAITPSMGTRVEANVLSYKGNVTAGEIQYDAKLKMNSVGVFYDYFPFASHIRMTTGAYLGNRKLDLTASGASTVVINSTTYDAKGESVYGSVKFPKVSPYLGIGYGHNANDSGISFVADVGIALGKPTVSLSASPGLTAAAGQANIDAERNKAQSDINSKYKAYPVIKIGMGYVF